MNAYKSIISFCLLLVAIKRGSCAYTPLDEKAVCVNSRLVQYANYYVCVCEEGKIHKDDLSCAEAITTKCTKADEICGDYQKCKAKGVAPEETFTCECITGYEFNTDTTPVCVPKGCSAIGKTCGNGVCSKKDDTNPICACNIGFKLDVSTGKCVEDKEEKPKCNLTCVGENVGCITDKAGFYDCGCVEGFVMTEGKCVALPPVDNYVPLTETSKCESGTLVQYGNYYSCVCDSGKVHSTELKCVDKISGDCTKIDEVCGEYSNCQAIEGEPAKHECKCIEGYEYDQSKPPVCVPLGCNGLVETCTGHSCIKKNSTDAQCGCNLQNKLDDDSGKCIADTTTPVCKLSCIAENTACAMEGGMYFTCKCKENFELKDGKCVESAKSNGGAFPASGILNVGLLFLASSVIYVLV